MPNFDPDLLARIPLSARTILHVGRGEAALIEAYRPANPAARIFGLSIGTGQVPHGPFDAAAAIPSAGDALPFDLDKPFDCIVYEDVLAWLDDPRAALLQHAGHLADAGTVVIRSRNDLHWRQAEALLSGSGFSALRRVHPGLGTHVIRQHLHAAGLQTADLLAQEADPDAAEGFIQAITPALFNLGIAPEDYRSQCLGSHVIWRARKAVPERLFVAGSMLNPVGGVSHVRVVHPLDALATEPGIETLVTDRVGPPAQDGSPRIFILHRPALAGSNGTRILTALAEAGYLIVTEFDDHPDHFDMMRNGGELTFTGVHALQTSTEPLAAELRKYNEEVAVFRNAVVSLPEPANFTHPDRLTVFFGALNREKDWQPLMPVLNEVAALAGERLFFQVVHDSQFCAALDTPHKQFTPTCDYETYRRLLGGSEICFMPLSDTPFNRAKSDLKFIEAASFRVAALASPIVYEGSIADGRTGFIFHDPDQLRLALMRLIALPGLARRAADEARAYVTRERMMAYQVSARAAWYRSLWERRASLEQARRVRLARYAGLAA